jgi:DNA-binding winged helix-turn-helix (wHTH) protein/tetratricopeptide (TPR) repeat protein
VARMWQRVASSRCQMPRSPSNIHHTIILGGGEVDLDAAVLRGPAGDVALTATEVGMLRHFLERPGVVVERSDLLRQVWGYRAGVVSRAVDHAVKRLRAKIETDRKNPKHLLTVTGRGYRFVLPAKPEPPPIAESESPIPVCDDPGVPQQTARDWLDDIAHVPGLHQLSGPPGTGKSRALARWAVACRAHGRSVLWLACANRSDAGSILKETCVALEAVNRLSPCDNLVVWDDTDDVVSSCLHEAASVLCARFATTTLVVSRCAPLQGPVVESLRMPRLTPDEARRLFHQRAKGPSLTQREDELHGLLEAVDLRPRAIEELAPLSTLFPIDALRQRLVDGVLNDTPRPTRTGLRSRTTWDAIHQAWEGLGSTERTVHAHCIALPSDFLATEVAAIIEQSAVAQVGDVFGALLELRRVGVLLPSPDRDGRSRIDPLVRAWWSGNATREDRETLESATRRRLESLVHGESGDGVAATPEQLRELEAGAHWAVERRHADLAGRLLIRCGASWVRTAGRQRVKALMVQLGSMELENPEVEARVFVLRATWLLGLGDRNSASRVAVDAVALARTVSSPTVRSEVYRQVGLLAFRLDLPPALGDLLDEAVQTVRDQPGSRALARALSARGGLRIDRGDYRAAEADLVEAIHHFDELGDPNSAARCRGRIATLRKLVGRLEEARVLYQSAIARMTPEGTARDHANLRMNYGNLLADLGRLAEARQTFEEAIESCMSGGETAFAASIRGSLATVLAEQGLYDEARVVFAEALRVHQLNGSRKQEAYCILGLAELAMDAGDLTTAGDLLDELESEMPKLGRPELFVAGALQRGVWLTRSGAPDAALTVLADCAAQMERHRLRRNQAGLHFARGLALAATGQAAAARAEAVALHAELQRLAVGHESVLWRRLVELELGDAPRADLDPFEARGGDS